MTGTGRKRSLIILGERRRECAQYGSFVFFCFCFSFFWCVPFLHALMRDLAARGFFISHALVHVHVACGMLHVPGVGRWTACHHRPLADVIPHSPGRADATRLVLQDPTVVQGRQHHDRRTTTHGVLAKVRYRRRRIPHGRCGRSVGPGRAST